MSTFRRKASLAVMLLSSLLLSACGGGGGGSVPMGTLGVSLTDSPACGFSAVNVTVSEVRVHQSSTATASDAGWKTIRVTPPQKINLLNLSNGVLFNLGQTALPAGHYTQLRLVLEPTTAGSSSPANSVILTGSPTTEIPLTTPSAVQSGIKLINQFDVPANQTEDLALDFNACKSVVTTGSGTYLLKPVIEVIPFTLNGIDGYVDTSLLNPTNSNNVMVYAEQQNGEIVRSTTPDPTTGKFVLARLDPGNYDVVITANGYATSVITGVDVATASSVVDVSGSGNPIGLTSTLPTPGTGSIWGKVYPLPPLSNDVTAYVAAQQQLTLANAPTITVQTQAADPVTGAYTLTLPLAPPEVVAYPSPPPVTPTTLTFSSDTAVAGQYQVQASAEGYTTSASTSENLSSANPSAMNVYLTLQ